MWPLVGIPQAIPQGMAAYRSVFCRDADFEHVSRYVSGLLLSTNKTSVKAYWAFTKVVRLKKYGRKRLVIVHETADLSDPPGFTP